MKNVNANEKFEKARDENNRIYLHWLHHGKCEGDAVLNNSNRALIQAYKLKHPSAKGYKMCEGIVDIDESVNNFGVDFIFKGDKELIKALENGKIDESKKVDILCEHQALAIVWS